MLISVLIMRLNKSSKFDQMMMYNGVDFDTSDTMYAQECPELTPDVPRVEEKHKYHTQKL